MVSSEKRATVGNYVYDAGRLFYKVNPRSKPLTQKLEHLAKAYPFIQLPLNLCEVYCTLEMEDIARPCDIPGYTKLQVPIEKAEARYAQFLEIWKDLTDWSEKIIQAVK